MRVRNIADTIKLLSIIIHPRIIDIFINIVIINTCILGSLCLLLGKKSIHIHVDFILIDTFGRCSFMQYSTFFFCNHAISDYRLNQLFNLF